MFQEGNKIGLYTLVRKLARGGFGEVWLAEKQSEFVTKKVAVKLPHAEQVDFEAIRQEATLWEAASGHPNVLPIIDADIYDGQVAIVSEYADGGSLADKLSVERKLSVREAVEMTIGILNGLEYLHSKQIVHRDIKPANILLQGNTPRLADFGISRAIHTSTITSVVVGTQSYMSPEAFEGVRSVQTDIWSVGVLLYKLLSGYLPFPQTQPTETMYAVLLKEPEPLPDDVPPELKEIVFKALEKDREPGENPPRRYQTAAAMRDDLKNFLETSAQTALTTKQMSAAFPTSSQTEEVITKVRISKNGNRKPFDFWQSLIKKPQPPLIIFSAVLGFAVFAWLVFYTFTRTSTPEQEIPAATVENPIAANANSGNANVFNSNSNGSTFSQSAFDYFTEGNKHFDRRRYDRAIAAFTKAIEINPSDFSFYNNRGLAFHKQRKYAEAINDFNKAVEFNPTSITYNNRGVAFEDSGDMDQAIADYRKAVELDPNDEKARTNLNKVLR